MPAAGVSDGALIVNTKMDNSGVVQGARQLEAQINGLRNAAINAGRQMAAGVNSYTQAMQHASGVANETQAQIARLESEAAKLQKSLTGDKIYSDSYRELTTQIEETERQIEQLQAQQATWAEMGISPDSAPFEEIDQKIFELMDHIDQLKARQEELKASGEAYTPDYLQAQGRSDAIQEQLGGLREKAQEESARYAGALQEIEASQARVAEATDQWRESLGVLDGPINAISGAFGPVVQSAGRALAVLGRFVGHGAVGFLRQLATGAKNAAIQLAKLAGSALRSSVEKLGTGIGRAAKSMFGFRNSTRQTSGSLKKGLMMLLKYGLGIRSLYMLFRKIRQAIIDGFGELEKRDPRIKKALTGLKTALGGLKGSLTTAFAPILTAVAPALTSLINMLTRAMNTVGAFLAALTGQGYYYAARGIEQTTEAARDLKRQLAGFDQLNVLSAKDGTDKGTGIGFEYTQIEGGVSEFAAKLRELWAAADYEGIGRTIAEGINGAFARVGELISWDNVGAAVTRFIRAFCDMFNGLVDGVDWAAIGAVFADGINTLIYSAYTLFEGIDWANIGQSISEGLNSLVEDVDWYTLGATLGKYLTARLQLLLTAVQNFDWANLGKKLSEAINGLGAVMLTAADGIDWAKIGTSIGTGLTNLITGIDWDSYATLIGNGINAVLTVLLTAVQNFKFSEAGTEIGTGITTLINTVDWENAGKLIGDAFKGALDFITKAIEAIDWTQLGKDVAKAVGAIDWSGVATSMFKAIGAALGGIGAFLAGLFNDACKSISDYFDDSIEAAGGNVIEGIFNGIINAVKGIGQWVVDHIFKPFIEGFKKAFGIGGESKNAASSSTTGGASEMEGPGGDIVAGIFQGIVNALKNVGQWVKTNIFGPIWNAIKDAGATVIEITVSLVKKIGEWASDVWAVLTSTVSTIVKTVQAAVEKAATWVADAWAAARMAAETIFKTVKAGVDKAATWVSDAWTAARMVAEEVFKTVKAGVDKAATWVSDAWAAARMAAETIFKTVKAGVDKAATWVSDAWTAARMAAETVFKTVKAGVDKATTWVNDAWQASRMVAGEIVKTVKAGVDKAATWVSDAWAAARMVAETVFKTVKAGIDKAATWVSDAWQAARMVAETIFKTVKAGVDKAATWVSDAWQASRMVAGEIVKTVKAGVDKAATWVSDAWTAARMAAETIFKTVKAGVDKAATWVNDAWAAARMVAGTITKTVNTVMGWASDLAETIYNWLVSTVTITKNASLLVKIADWIKGIIDFLRDPVEATKSIILSITTLVAKKWEKFWDWLLTGGGEADGPAWGEDVGLDVTINPEGDGQVLVPDGAGGYYWTTEVNADAQMNATPGDGLSDVGANASNAAKGWTLTKRISGSVSLAAKVGKGFKALTGGAWSLSSAVSGAVKLAAKASSVFTVSGAVLALKNVVSGVAKLGAKAGAGLTGSKAKFSLSDAVSGFASLAAKAGKGLRTGDKGLELKDNINATAVADLVKSSGWASALGGALEVLGLLGLTTTVPASMSKQWGTKDPLDVLGLTALAAVVRITMDLVGKVGKAILQALGLSGNGDNTGANPPTLTMQVALAKDPKSLWNSFKTAWDAQKPSLTVSVGLDKANVLNGVSSLNYHAPAMASGSVMPYDVSAQLAKSTADLQGTLDANNEDLIQTIISVASQIVAAVGRLNPQPVPAGGMSTQEIINELNKRTQMYGSNPLKGV